GTAICTEANTQQYASLYFNGTGVVIAWTDGRDGDQDIYAQFVDLNGNPHWDPNGTAICTIANTQDFPQVTGDGSGNFYIEWRDWTSPMSIRAKKVNYAGNAIWGGSDGLPIASTSSSKGGNQIISDGDGGAIICWWDDRNGGFHYEDIYAQRIDSSGAGQWGVNGTGVCTANRSQGSPRMISDGNGGAIIAWQDCRRAPNLISPEHVDIFLQRVNQSGIGQWGANGTAVCTVDGWKQFPMLCNDSSGNIFVVWQDRRDGITDSDIYAQKLDENGVAQWTVNGTLISNATSYQEAPKVISDGAGGAIIAWRDSRNGAYYDIYAQRVDSNGVPQGADDGVAVCTAIYHQWGLEMCSDDNGGAFLVWEDERTDLTGSGSDIYAQRVYISPKNGGGIPGFSLLYLIIGALAIISIHQRKRIS
ncbi:MAG TPA: hypothetical protein VMV49_18205, partial [Candidatus Deferrimicrobium sp.]|nr:hypothetical protein [Candidatus Deferrimicrobium sp.]